MSAHQDLHEQPVDRAWDLRRQHCRRALDPSDQWPGDVVRRSHRRRLQRCRPPGSHLALFTATTTPRRRHRHHRQRCRMRVTRHCRPMRVTRHCRPMRVTRHCRPMRARRRRRPMRARRRRRPMRARRRRRRRRATRRHRPGEGEQTPPPPPPTPTPPPATPTPPRATPTRHRRRASVPRRRRRSRAREPSSHETATAEWISCPATRREQSSRRASRGVKRPRPLRPRLPLPRSSRARSRPTAIVARMPTAAPFQSWKARAYSADVLVPVTSS